MLHPASAAEAKDKLRSRRRGVSRSELLQTPSSVSASAFESCMAYLSKIELGTSGWSTCRELPRDGKDVRGEAILSSQVRSWSLFLCLRGAKKAKEGVAAQVLAPPHPRLKFNIAIWSVLDHLASLADMYRSANLAAGPERDRLREHIRSKV